MTDAARDELINDAKIHYEKLKVLHEMNLDSKGVFMPPFWTDEESKKVNFAALQIIYLYKNLRKLVSRDDIANYVRAIQPDAANDQQPRQLKYKGWDIRLGGKASDEFEGQKVPNGFNVLVSVEHISEYYATQKTKRKVRMEAKDWVGKLIAYENACACCGKTGCKLEQGHKDPRVGLSLENSIPMCSICNNWASDNYIFDDDGKVVGLANSKIVLKSDEKVQYEIFLALREKFATKKSAKTNAARKPSK